MCLTEAGTYSSLGVAVGVGAWQTVGRGIQSRTAVSANFLWELLSCAVLHFTHSSKHSVLPPFLWAVGAFTTGPGDQWGCTSRTSPPPWGVGTNRGGFAACDRGVLREGGERAGFCVARILPPAQMSGPGEECGSARRPRLGAVWRGGPAAREPGNESV